ERAYACRLQALQIGRGLQTALGHDRHLARSQRSERLGDLEARDERAQVAVVDADEGRAAARCALELLARMNLDQGVEVEAARQPKELAQRGVVEDRADQQHGVRAEGAGLVDL